ncbi:MAG: methyltransferase domain-containing protein [Chromatiales bacterium]|nr:methyltransferase domain-containing protein [Chromatiales bacterium]
MKDSWQSGDPYEYFMGRWSRLVAEEFVDWLAPGDGRDWLDVGCGSGALSEAVIRQRNPASHIAIDQSEGFVSTAQKRLGERASCRVGDALALPLGDDSVDVTVSGLVLNFIPEPEKALAEMRRVTRPGGTVAVYIWDYAGTMEFLNQFWDTVVELNPDAANLHEGHRFPDANAEELAALFRRAGLTDVETAPMNIVTRFATFDDYWQPFLGGQGPAPTYVASLEETSRNALRDALKQRLPVEADGSITLAARAWGARGQV